MLKAVCVADLHVGSNTGLCDPAETPKSCPGKEIQKEIFHRWREASTGSFHKPDALVINGDAIDGCNPKEAGKGQWTVDIQRTIDHCAELIQMWKAKRIYIIGGSAYHVQIGHTALSAEELLAQKVKAEFYPNQENIPDESKARSGPHWFLTFDKVTCHVAHHIGVSKVFAYMSTPIARQMMQAKLNDPMRKTWSKMYKDCGSKEENITTMLESLDALKTRYVIRAHAHYFWLCDSGGMTGINLPAWKCPDPWLQEKDPLANGHIGFLGMKIEGDKCDITKSICGVDDIAPAPHTRINTK